jgi:hypothetical protein
MSKGNGKKEKELKESVGGCIAKSKEKVKEVGKKIKHEIIAESTFTTLSSLKVSIVLAEIRQDKKPKFMAFTKKGKEKELSVKKSAILSFTAHDSFELYEDGKLLVPLRSIEISSDEEKKETWNVYEVSFKTFVNALTDSLLIYAENDTVSDVFVAKKKGTGEVYRPWEVSKSVATICSEDDDAKTIDLRFDL